MNKTIVNQIKTVSSLLLDGAISPVEVTKIALEKAAQLKHFNAFINITEKEALTKAAQSSTRYESGNTLSELDGIPIAIKDNFCTANITTTCASKMLENFVPSYDSRVYQKLIAAGAIPIGKTNLDQFAMGSGTVDSIYGPTKNPWCYEENGEDFYISGGSSGGSAVAVATGICYAAIGSDTGGSTRNPASYCGLVGLKPTYGLVSRWGLIPLVNSMDVPGILTRTVDDCVAVLNTVAGPDVNDSTSLTKPFKKIRLPSANKLSVQNLKIGIPMEYYTEHLDPEVLDTWNDISQILEDSGAIIKQVSLPHTEFSIVCYSILNQCEVASNMARYSGIEFGLRHNECSSTEELYAASRERGFNDVVRNRILVGNYFLLSRNYEKYFNQALKVRRLISSDFDSVWEDVQVLLTPTTLSTAPLYSEFVKKTNRDQCVVQDFCTQPANMAGVPAVTIPIKLSKNKMPLSLQVIGRKLSEPMVLALAKFIENIVQFPHYVNSK